MPHAAVTSLSSAALLALIWGSPAFADAGEDQDGQGTVPEASYAPHTPQFFTNHFFTRLPFEVTNAFRSDPEFTQWPWVCDPEYAHDTGPTPDEYRYAGEFDLTNGVIFGMGEWTFGSFMSDQRELIRASLETTAEVTILTEQKLIPNVKRGLRAHGFTDAQIERINFAPVKVDSIWIRDYGPEFLRHEDDDSMSAMVDPTYSATLPRPDNCRPLERGPLTFLRGRDDASPTRLQALVESGGVKLRGVETARVYRAPLVFEGGNIFTDGEGTCFRNRLRAEAFNTTLFFSDPSVAGGWSYSAETVDDMIASYYNCSEVVVLDSMRPTAFEPGVGGVLDHIDLSVTFLSPDTVVVGDYNYRTDEGEYLTVSGAGEPDDPINAAILDANAALLESKGYDVVRIPMPVPHCTIGSNCAHDFNRDLSSDTIISCPDWVYDDNGRFIGGFDPETGEPILRNWATFTNSIRIGDSLMMPSFQATSAALPEALREVLETQEAEARRVYEQELDRLYEREIPVVPVPSDGLAPCNGSLQCITKTY